ncbi:unnamed protein product [Bursaphelenchus okinawaensis]|uniref:Uncharacterized protein n=1 Tax=Bursaphelenchus okinawaensis TaxID=465554 RepID=A0A811JRQ6_9BILA|nr:unnamed protein product [Bursaphelenchus okinawaensis]CAG9079565.1 unnamed protein product [Bursaphelenchus okinawaensis]
MPVTETGRILFCDICFTIISIPPFAHRNSNAAGCKKGKLLFGSESVLHVGVGCVRLALMDKPNTSRLSSRIRLYHKPHTNITSVTHKSSSISSKHRLSFLLLNTLSPTLLTSSIICISFLSLVPTVSSDVYTGYNAANKYQHRAGDNNAPVILPNYYHAPNDKENRPHDFWAENVPKPHFHGGRPIDLKLHQHVGVDESDFPQPNAFVTDRPGTGMNINHSPCSSLPKSSSNDQIDQLDDGVEVRQHAYNPDCDSFDQVQVTPSPFKVEYDPKVVPSISTKLPYPQPGDLLYQKPFPKPQSIVLDSGDSKGLDSGYSGYGKTNSESVPKERLTSGSTVNKKLDSELYGYSDSDSTVSKGKFYDSESEAQKVTDRPFETTLWSSKESNWPIDTNSNYDYDGNSIVAKPIDQPNNSEAKKNENSNSNASNIQNSNENSSTSEVNMSEIDCLSYHNIDHPACNTVTQRPKIQHVVSKFTKVPFKLSTSGSFITHPTTLEFIWNHTTNRPKSGRYESPNSSNNLYDHKVHHDDSNNSNDNTSYGNDSPNSSNYGSNSNIPSSYHSNSNSHHDESNSNNYGSKNSEFPYDVNSSTYTTKRPVYPPGAIPPEDTVTLAYGSHKNIKTKKIHRYYNDGHTTRSGGSYVTQDDSEEAPFTATQDLYTRTTPVYGNNYGEYTTALPRVVLPEVPSYSVPEVPAYSLPEVPKVVQPELYHNDNNNPYISNQTYEDHSPEQYTVERFTVTKPIIESGYEFNGEEKSKYDSYPKVEVTDESYHGGTVKSTPSTASTERAPYVPPVTVTPSYNPYDAPEAPPKHTAHPPGQQPPYETPVTVTPKYIPTTTYNYPTSTATPYTLSTTSTTAYEASTANPYDIVPSTVNPYNVRPSTVNPYNVTPSTANPYDIVTSTVNPYDLLPEIPTATVDYNNRFKTVIPQRNAYPPGQEPPYEEDRKSNWRDGYDYEKGFKHPHPTPPTTPPRYDASSSYSNVVVPTTTQKAYSIPQDFPTPYQQLEVTASTKGYESSESYEAESILALSPTPFSVTPTTTDYTVYTTVAPRVVTVTARPVSSTVGVSKTAPSSVAYQVEEEPFTPPLPSTVSPSITPFTVTDDLLESYAKTGFAGAHGADDYDSQETTGIDYTTPASSQFTPTVYSTVSISLKHTRNYADNDADIPVKAKVAGGHGQQKPCCSCCQNVRPQASFVNQITVPRTSYVQTNRLSLLPVNDAYPVPVTNTPAQSASPWFAPGGGPFPWAVGSQGCGGPCNGNPQPCCGPTAPKPCCPNVPNCCQTPCCPKISLPCCPQQSLCCDQGSGCGQCRSKAALRLRTKRTLCLPCNGRKKRDIFDELVHTRQKRLGCQYCSRKKRQTCQTCTSFQQSIFGRVRNSMSSCTQCPTVAHRKKREAEIQQYYTSLRQHDGGIANGKLGSNIVGSTISRQSRQTYSEQCDASCCDYSKCPSSNPSYNVVLAT